MNWEGKSKKCSKHNIKAGNRYRKDCHRKRNRQDRENGKKTNEHNRGQKVENKKSYTQREY